MVDLAYNIHDAERKVVEAVRAFIEADQKMRAVGSLEGSMVRDLRLALVALDLAVERAK